MRDSKRFKTTAKFLADDANYMGPKIWEMFNRVVREPVKKKMETSIMSEKKDVLKPKTKKGMGLFNLRLGLMGRKL